MIKFIVVVREPGSVKPDYSLEFEAPQLPRTGEYISIQRPDKQRPYGEDMVVRNVWWRFSHPETAGVTDNPKTGALDEIFVECEPAGSPYSSRHWRNVVERARKQGVDLPEFEVERFSVPE